MPRKLTLTEKLLRAVDGRPGWTVTHLKGCEPDIRYTGLHGNGNLFVISDRVDGSVRFGSTNDRAGLPYYASLPPAVKWIERSAGKACADFEVRFRAYVGNRWVTVEPF